MTMLSSYLSFVCFMLENLSGMVESEVLAVLACSIHFFTFGGERSMRGGQMTHQVLGSGK